ncbi:MAG TPA: hypothetical protein VFF09_02200 [archaeon]|nr:hypothetical protein [archaeon]
MKEGQKFWDGEKILLALVFLAGLIIGAALANQVIDPLLFSGKISDSNTLIELNERLDARNDQLFNCLVKNEIEPSSCK